MAGEAGTEGQQRGRRRIPGDDLRDELTEQLERSREEDAPRGACMLHPGDKAGTAAFTER